MKNIKEALLIIVAAVLVILSIGLFISKEGQRALKNDAAATLNTLRKSLNRLGDDADDKEKLRDKLRKRFDELSRESTSLEVQITQIKKIYNESEEQLAVMEKDISSSQEEIKDLLTKKKQLINKVSSAESEIEKLENQLALLRRSTGALERHLKKMMRIYGIKIKEEPQESIHGTRVEAKPVIRSTISQTAPASRQAVGLTPIPAERRTPLEGEVLVVNREFNFIVISLGKHDGLIEGDCLSVYDGDKLLGKVFVETVRKNISAASGGKDLDSYRIRSGNRVYLEG